MRRLFRLIWQTTQLVFAIPVCLLGVIVLVTMAWAFDTYDRWKYGEEEAV